MANKKSSTPILKIKNVDIVFGRGRKEFKAVSDASFDIYKGETVSLVGESGSGKTTIGRAVVRINPVRKGYITFDNRLINGKIPEEEKGQFIKALEEELEIASSMPDGGAKVAEIKAAINTVKTGKITFKQSRDIVRKIQMIFQDPAASLNERATIEYIISEGLNNFHLYKDEKDRIAKIEKIITDVGLLPEHLTRYPHEFSGGQRQRVGLARSIVMEPEFIVADEPISALDVSIRAQVLNLLKKFQSERGLTYLFIAHDLSIVRFISDRIVVIHHGKIVEIAETEELFEHPLHPYTKSLMSAIPIPDPILEKNKELFVYEPDKCHDYSVHKPSLVDIGNGHFVYGNEEEIANYKKIRG
ncbi:MAG: ATP-binding cassette domain-containing protein [Bacilli bacterium]|nr:ATP-binding cassette domain-containing protein [Bacilli bacterium]